LSLTDVTDLVIV